MTGPRATRTGIASSILASLGLGVWFITLVGYRHSMPRAQGYLLGALFLVAAAGVQLAALWRRRRDVAIARSGTRAAAVVESLSRIPISAAASAEEYYALHYRYEAPGGTYSGSVLLPKSLAWQWRQGDRGWVRYDPREEHRSYWEADTPAPHLTAGERCAPAPEPAPPTVLTLGRRSPSLRQAVPAMPVLLLAVLIVVPPTLKSSDAAVHLLMAAIGVYLSWWLGSRLFIGARELVRASRILREGVSIDGAVIAVHEMRRPGGRQSFLSLVDWYIEVEYRPAVGHEQVARVATSQKEALALRAGDRVVIKVDASAPRSAVLLGKA